MLRFFQKSFETGLIPWCVAFRGLALKLTILTCLQNRIFSCIQRPEHKFIATLQRNLWKSALNVRNSCQFQSSKKIVKLQLHHKVRTRHKFKIPAVFFYRTQTKLVKSQCYDFSGLIKRGIKSNFEENLIFVLRCYGFNLISNYVISSIFSLLNMLLRIQKARQFCVGFLFDIVSLSEWLSWTGCEWIKRWLPVFHSSFP